MFYACKGAHTLFTSQREREGEREKERDVEYVIEFISLLLTVAALKRNDGCLGTF
jgi:hypothetical protein